MAFIFSALPSRRILCSVGTSEGPQKIPQVPYTADAVEQRLDDWDESLNISNGNHDVVRSSGCPPEWAEVQPASQGLTGWEAGRLHQPTRADQAVKGLE
jgi:hypothetical protein